MSLSYIFGYKGLLWILTYSIWILIPKTITTCLFTKGSLDFTSALLIRITRYALSDGNVLKARYIMSILDSIHFYLTKWSGYTIQLEENSIIKGLWLHDRRTSLPMDWTNSIIVLWFHGGGFGIGSSSNYLLTHARIISEYNQSNPGKKLVYFCVEYPLAPQASLDESIKVCLSAYYWLKKENKSQSIIIGGDSAGGNLALQVLKRIPESDSVVSGCLLVSPWLDLSLTYPTPLEFQKLLETKDLMSINILEKWAQNTIKDTNWKEKAIDPNISPFFQTNPLLLPPLIVVVGSSEAFGPSIKNWVKKQSKLQPVHVIQGRNMPHDHLMMGSMVPFGQLSRECKEGCKSISQYLTEITCSS